MYKYTTTQEKLEAYLEQNNMYSFEGQCGINNLEKLLLEVCGYRSINEYLLDNSSAIEAIIDCIGTARVPEWGYNLDALVQDDEEDEDGFGDDYENDEDDE